jgi:MtrB/PioB family decaheme-associated outer membrane protein
MTYRFLSLCLPSVGGSFTLVAVLFAGVVTGQDVHEPIPGCSLCSPASGWEFDVTAGPVVVFGDDLFNFGDYTGLDQEGLYLSGGLFARYWGEDAQFFNFEGYRLGLDSRAIFVEGGKQGLYTARASYQGIPRRIFDTTATPYRQVDRQKLDLPNGWVRAPTTQGMTALGNSLQQVKIERDWKIYELGAGFTPTSRWDFDVNYRHQAREGNEISSGSFFFSATEFAAPVDDTTDELELSALYSGDTWQISASYWGVLFDNAVSSLTWDNPYTAQTPGTDSGQLARAPDNESHQLKLAGSAFLPGRTTLTGQISVGQMTQDDAFLPYTTNTQIATNALPSTSANAKVDTTNLALRVTSSPTRKFTVEGEYRANERDNRTPEQVFDYVVTDIFNAPNSATNVAYDYERSDFRLRGEYRITRRIRVHAGYDFEDHERAFQERQSTETQRFWGQIRARPIRQFDLDFKIYNEKRDGSAYTPITNVPEPQNPLMRKYNMADRERRGIKANITGYATDRINLGLSGEYNEDEYADSVIGLVDNDFDHLRLGLDGSYLFRQDITLYGALFQENIEASQANSQTFSLPDWKGTTEDSFLTGNLGLQFPNLVGRWGANAQYLFTQSEGETINNTNGLVSRFPTLESRMQQLRFGFDFRYSESLSLQLNYQYERFRSDDWALEGVGPATVPNLLALGANPVMYDAHVFFIGVRYVFDTRGQSGPRIDNRQPY